MATEKTKAIVLGGHVLGEADRIVAFYSRDFGKIRAVARGVRKAKSRLCGRLEILTYGELVFFEKVHRDLHIVNSFDIIESFQDLREDLLKMAYCSYLVDLIQQVESLSVPDIDIFDLLLNIMSMMKNPGDPEMIVRTFEIRFLDAAGFTPHLDSCIACAGSIDSTDTFLKFSVEKGGVLCGRCGKTGINEQDSIFSISRGTLELIKKMQQIPLELVPRLRMLDISRRELKRLLRSFISFHLDLGSLRSLDFLTSIEKDIEQSAFS